MNVPARVPEGRVIRSSEEWREIVADFEREGGAAVDYCARRGLGAQTLLRWRRRLAREAKAVPAFVSLGPAPMDSLAWDAELDLGGGMVLRLRRRNC